MMRIKVISLILCLLLGISILAGCGAAKTDESTNEAVTTSEQTANAEQPKDNNNATTQSTVKKKVVCVTEADDVSFRVDEMKKAIEALEKGGFKNNENVEITELTLANDEKKGPEIVNKIKEINPDVAIIGSGVFIGKAVLTPLTETTIPVVTTADIDKTPGLIDKDGKPLKNITGLLSMPKDMQANAFQLLQKICPTNGKKAVFVTVDGKFKREDVESSLKQANVELKDFCESKYIEDFQAAIQKYNNDNDVAWILVGVWPTTKKDGSTVTIDNTAKWDIANRKKPSVTYFEVAVQYGMLAGLGVDIPERGAQAGELACKLLNGAKVADTNAIYPRKTSIILNQKIAKDMNITIPADILGSASKVYDSTINDAK